MWLFYLIALILGGGFLFLQLVLGGGDHDVHVHGLGAGDAHPGHGPGLLSTRSLTFGLAAFGLVGAPLHILHILPPTLALTFAVAAAAAAVVASALAFRRLGDPAASGAVSLNEVVGREARVLLACARDQTGKVRVELGGQVVDLLATTDAASIEPGTVVRVVDVRDEVAHVAPSARSDHG
jgi:membrane protein implicated in regulation of membrane protease activity